MPVNQSAIRHISLQRTRIFVFGWLLIPITAMACGFGYQTLANAYDRRVVLPPGQLIKTDNGSQHLYCTGERDNARPTVVLEGGLGAPALLWALVQPEIAKHTRVCSYDRAGYGWSDESSHKRDALELATELRELLRQAGEQPLFILVGHSFGGIIARVYAATYPTEVAGMILVDARHESTFERMPAEFLEVDERNLRNARLLQLSTPLGFTRLAGTLGWLDHFETYLEPLPDDMEKAAWALMINNPHHWNTAVAEREAINVSYTQAETAHLPGTLPLIVLSAENGADAWRSSNDRADSNTRDLWMELQGELSGLTAASQWIIVKDSGHYIYFDQPSAIVDAVVSMLGP